MKIGKNIKLFIILILILVIIFVLLGHFNLFKEGLAPKCTNSEITSDDTDHEYYLSTTMIPPICPTCPYYEPSNLTGHSHYYDISGQSGSSGSGSGSILDGVFGSSGSGSNNKIKDSNNNNKITNTNSNTTNTDIKTTQNQDITQQSQVNKINTDNSTNTSSDNSVTSNQVSQDSSVNQDMSQTQTATQTSDSKFNNLLGNNSIMFGSFGGGGSGSNTVSQNAGNGLMPVSSPESVNSASLTPYDKIKTTDPETLSMINEMKATITKLNQQSQQNKETCPPCPACERCPEPAFECKKVPNYRSPSIDNYMPVPVLNDFSNF
jgi:hypothetical protein